MKVSKDIIKDEKVLLESENQQLKMKVLELENRIADLQIQPRTHNERNAGRKEYQDKDIIRRIFLMYSQAKSFQQIADRLNIENILTKSGGTWSKSSVRYIFNNKTYIKKGILSEKEFNNLDF